MSKFIIACPVCHNYAEASTGFFASKHIRCSCGNVINVKTDRMATTNCPGCGNNVVYDQSEGKNAKCPICHTQLITDASFSNLVHFACPTCGCFLQAAKSATMITCPVCDTVSDVQQEIKKAEVRNAGIPTVIGYEGDNKTFVWKHPMTDFVTGSQLIVHESQEAIFYRNGEALDSFGPGRYTLETGILPKMDSLYHFKLYPVEWTRALVRRMLGPRSVDRTQPVPSPDCGQWISAKPRVVDIQAANGRFAETPIRVSGQIHDH